jgi:hypothetical protein
MSAGLKPSGEMNRALLSKGKFRRFYPARTACSDPDFMRRNGTTFSPIALLLLASLSTGMVLLFWHKGGMAFSPGKLSGKEKPGVTPGGFRSHAEYRTSKLVC